MDDILVYFGDVLQQELIWDEDELAYRCITHIKSFRDNMFPVEGLLNIRDINKILLYRVPKFRSTNRLIDLINKTHLRLMNDVVWLKFSTDKSEWKDVLYKDESEEGRFKEYLELTEKRFNKVRRGKQRIQSKNEE